MSDRPLDGQRSAGSGGRRHEAAAGEAPHPGRSPIDTFLLYLTGCFAGPRTLAAVRELERAQWLSPEELQARTEARLAPLLRHAAENVPFYRETYRRLGLAPDALRTLADLTRLPITSKSTRRQYPSDYFLAAHVPPYRRVSASTSGSTGEPFRFYLDRKALPETPEVLASRLLFDSWYGLRATDRSLRISTPRPVAPPLPGNMPRLTRLRWALTAWLKSRYGALTQHKITLWALDGEKVEGIYRRIEAFRPDYLIGYSSTMAFVAHEMLQRGLQPRWQPRAVITGAEMLTPGRRRVIEECFAAPIINRFGMREIGSYFAQSCPASPEQFHVNPDRVVWETVREDGAPAAPGEVGRVVLTVLDNDVMPFIRYETGDLAVAGGAPCACGRGFPLVGPVQGRSVESIHTPSGKLIGPAVLGHFLFAIHDYVNVVRHYQLVQEAPDRARLLVVPAPGGETGWQRRLHSDLNWLLGGELKVTVDIVSHIAPEPSGKRPIIKRLAPVERLGSGGALVRSDIPSERGL